VATQPLDDFRQRCFREYNSSIGLPSPYLYPDGNPIRPVLPVHTATAGLMIVGAYPSARFERRPSSTKSGYRVVPVADNLHPFAIEEYFDGIAVRRLTSGDELTEQYLRPLGLLATECWVTDLVKVFLYKQEHRDSCADACPGFEAPLTRPMLLSFGKASLRWLAEEVRLARPRLILTLGEHVARAITGDTRSPSEDLLGLSYTTPATIGSFRTLMLPHPEACRRMAKWRNRLLEQLAVARAILAANAA